MIALAAGKELAVLGHGDGEVASARRHRPRPDSRDAGSALRAPAADQAFRRERDDWQAQRFRGKVVKIDCSSDDVTHQPIQICNVGERDGRRQAGTGAAKLSCEADE